MRFYKTTGTIRLSAGIVLALSPDQVQRRQYLLTQADDGMVTARDPIEFKAGEIIGFEHEPLALLALLEPVAFDDVGDVEMVGMGESVGADSSAKAARLPVGTAKPTKKPAK